MLNNGDARKLSVKLHEMIVEDLDFKDSEINRYVDNQALNLILTKLPLPRRSEFYQLIANNDLEQARSLVLKAIPDFHKQLLIQVRGRFQKIL